MMEKVYALMSGAKKTFVYTILTKWYVLIAIPAMTITYIVFVELNKLGIFDIIIGEIEYHLLMLEDIARNCTQEILNIKGFLRCLGF